MRVHAEKERQLSRTDCASAGTVNYETGLVLFHCHSPVVVCVCLVGVGDHVRRRQDSGEFLSVAAIAERRPRRVD